MANDNEIIWTHKSSKTTKRKLPKPEAESLKWEKFLPHLICHVDQEIHRPREARFFIAFNNSDYVY